VRQRGRRSAAAAAVVIQGAFGQRPEPPDDLTPRQAELWRQTVASENPDFFDTAALRGLLVDYCRHREAGENISGIINQFNPEWLKTTEGASRYAALLRMRELESRAAAAMARALRLTNQSRYTPKTGATAGRQAARGPLPWET
jgi:hypothetical protein